MLKRQKIRITGTVQGVGFRPAVHRIANKLELTGFVYNDSLGVTIELQGPQETISRFIEQIQKEMPPLANIKSLRTKNIAVVEKEKQFLIKESRTIGNAVSEVTADIATCKDCLSEMNNPDDFRYRYPFINCTNCGPRYSIVKTIPYDRVNTTMSAFQMCEQCATQYDDVADRRFHAQPVACGSAAPKYGWPTTREK